MIEAIIFDFDGVIAESMDVKREAFRELFKEHREKVDEIERFHMDNGGMSRYDKFRYIYKNILGRELSRERFEKLCASFHELVVDKVVEAPFVKGAREVLDRSLGRYPMYIVSGTPEDEINEIVKRRGLNKYFIGIYGSPAGKAESINKILGENGYNRKKTLFIGDSKNDLQAAQETGVTFIARVAGQRQEWSDSGYVSRVMPDLEGLKEILNVRGEKMKLVIQVPCYNEEKTLPLTLKDLPKSIRGIDEIETLVINDGSTDMTEKAASRGGADHTLNLPVRSGLAEAFRSGIEKSLELGADIIVNTDGDNQYCGEDIAKLVEPILSRKAEIVIGCRDMKTIEHFSPVKRSLQNLGSKVVRKFSGTDIPDTTSGFRAYSREAALRLNVFSSSTYTLESIIQAGRQEIPITHVQIRTNEKLRESRLIKSIPSYLMKSTATILRIYLMYEPLKTFFTIGMIFIIPGILLVLRFLYFHFTACRSGLI
ncbi:MAG: HAD-IA family hydrolase, partial [Candidatus Omnitrophota bacterium]